jgi:hypothetical protein
MPGLEIRQSTMRVCVSVEEMPPDIGEIIHRDQTQLRFLNNKLYFLFPKRNKKKEEESLLWQ